MNKLQFRGKLPKTILICIMLLFTHIKTYIPASLSADKRKPTFLRRQFWVKYFTE